jgi:hypothetical protein
VSEGNAQKGLQQPFGPVLGPFQQLCALLDYFCQTSAISVKFLLIYRFGQKLEGLSFSAETLMLTCLNNGANRDFTAI